ncbi:MAG: malonyl CoA-acyl carrier protein transacylase FabD [Idiomarinaceae bacterium HL-53]|nr:MAG: malonyl CoA-acyl carrier protein transacylase FabD [Idiomarinaceae bacterium HL-53]CUS48943.1 [acyl-carrier-protein] S-malonyltransferase [Idiomarinaceae bacterium HL-53]
MTKRAFIFPGQGSQAKGMLADLADQYPIVSQTFAEASEVLGYDLWKVVQANENEQLNQTEVTQPAILTASVAVYRALGEPEVDFMAGHSLGEYSALVCAGALEFAEAVRLVALRGRAMQAAVPAGVGAMAAVIGLDDIQVVQACEHSAQGEVVAAVNFNSPGQVVIAGNKDAVTRAADACKTAGAKRVLPLPVSVPSHCDLMQPAARELKAALATMKISMPRVPVIHNVNVAEATNEDELRSLLVQQLYSPVRWTETVQKLALAGVTDCFEIGPGKVLAGLVKRIDKTVSCESIGDLAGVQSFQALTR